MMDARGGRDPRMERVVDFFEGLQPESLERLDDIYAGSCSFKDPFNEVRGLSEVRRIFAHMYVSLEAPHFRVHEALVQGDQGFLTWDFLFRFKRYCEAPQVVRGSTHLRFDPDGRIEMHRDYWDAAEELYEKLPAVGALMRWLKRRVNA